MLFKPDLSALSKKVRLDLRRVRPTIEALEMALRENSFAYKVTARLVPKLVSGFENAIALASGNRTFFSPGDYPWIKEIEREWPEMQRELQNLLAHQQAKIPEFKNISEEQAKITDGEWRTFMFYVYEQQVAKNCAACPETARILKKIPGMTTGLFSVLKPGTRLTPHRGPYKGVLRYHLGLIIPPDRVSCGIKVGNDTRHWSEGESMVFDDTHEHQAWNDSDQIRAVLFVDFIRDLPFPLNRINRAVIKLMATSPFVQEMMTKLNDRVSDVAQH
jgi:ornithine lipid ester-linked acyl 2-hydroxylase